MLFSVCVFVAVATVVCILSVLVFKKASKKRLEPEERVILGVFFVVVGIVSTLLGHHVAANTIAGFTGRAGCDWKMGAVVGTVVQAEIEGQIFNTHEGLMVLGKDGGGHTFKVSDHDMYPYLGMNVEVRYMSCHLPNWRRGNSRNYVIGVTVLEKQCATETTLRY